jgi:ketosteroid isomerase-like protein
LSPVRSHREPPGKPDTARAMPNESLKLVALAHEYLNEGDIDALIALCDGGNGSGLEMARDAAMVWTVADDRAASVRFYTDQTEALGAAGLSS